MNTTVAVAVVPTFDVAQWDGTISGATLLAQWLREKTGNFVEVKFGGYTSSEGLDYVHLVLETRMKADHPKVWNDSYVLVDRTTKKVSVVSEEVFKTFYRTADDAAQN